MGAQIESVMARGGQPGRRRARRRPRGARRRAAGHARSAARLVPRLIDEVPILAVAACLADGPTEIRDAAELRVKESDRIRAIATELGRLGARITERPDGLRIEGGARLRGAVVQSGGDHRMAMALVVAGLLADGETVVEDTECIATSFPGFLRRGERSGGRPGGTSRSMSAGGRREPVITIDGPAGAGKSTAARELARRLGFRLARHRRACTARSRGRCARRAFPPRTAPRCARCSRTRPSSCDRATGCCVNGRDVTGEIRTPEIGELTSLLTMLRPVRDKLTPVQRALAAPRWGGAGGTRHRQRGLPGRRGEVLPGRRPGRAGAAPPGGAGRARRAAGSLRGARRKWRGATARTWGGRSRRWCARRTRWWWTRRGSDEDAVVERLVEAVERARCSTRS